MEKQLLEKLEQYAKEHPLEYVSLSFTGGLWFLFGEDEDENKEWFEQQQSTRAQISCGWHEVNVQWTLCNETIVGLLSEFFKTE